MDSPNVVIVGHVCVDHNTTESAAYTGWGSSALYIAQYLQARHYLVPLVVSNYGPDLVPYLPAIEMLPNKPNQAKTLLYENDTRVVPRIWKAYNTDFAEPSALTPAIITALEQADILIVATLLPNYSAGYLQQLTSHLKASCFKVLCPQGYLRHIRPDGLVVPRDFAEADDVVPLFDVVVYSEEDHPKAFEIAKAWLQAAPQTKIIVTQGPNGASIVSGNQVQHIPTTPIPKEKIIDSVGCGDVFDAALAYAYFTKRDLPEAVRVAHKAAGQKLLATPVLSRHKSL